MTTITQERVALNAQGLNRRLREQWGSNFNYTDTRAVDEPATRLFLHITVTNPGAYASNDAHARAVEAIGKSRFPSTGGSYNGLLMPGGLLYELQPIGRRGAHTVNDFQRSVCTPHGNPITAPGWNLNYNARALALARNVGDAVTDDDVHAAARWGAALKRSGFAARNAKWCGHRCCASKACPGDKGFARIHEIEAWTEYYYINGLQPQEDDMSLADVRLGIAQMFDEAAQRNTSSGRQLGDDLARIMAGSLPGVWTSALTDPVTSGNDSAGHLLTLARADALTAATRPLPAPTVDLPPDLAAQIAAALAADPVFLDAIAKATNDELAKRTTPTP